MLICASVLIFGLFSSAVNKQQQDDESTAWVKTRQGIEIYVFSDPVREYEIIGEVAAEDATSIISALAGEETCRNIVEQIDVLLKNAKRKVKKGKMEEFDAIMTDDGDIGVCIKFIE